MASHGKGRGAERSGARTGNGAAVDIDVTIGAATVACTGTARAGITRTGTLGSTPLAAAISSIPAVTMLHTAWRAAGDFTRHRVIAVHAIAASPSVRTVTPAR